MQLYGDASREFWSNQGNFYDTTRGLILKLSRICANSKRNFENSSIEIIEEMFGD